MVKRKRGGERRDRGRWKLGRETEREREEEGGVDGVREGERNGERGEQEWKRMKNT